MKYKLLRFSLLSMLAMLGGIWGNSAWAADKWVKTDAASLQSGDVVVIVDQTSSMALSNDKGTSAAPVATSVTLNGDKNEITSSVTTALQWVVTVNTGETTTYQFGVADTENYLYCTNTNNGVRVGTNENNKFKWVADAENSNSTEPFLVNEGTSRYIGVYNSQDWRCYTSINNNIKATVTAFYKLVKDQSDNRAVTSITLGEHVVTGEAGKSIDLPTATVKAGETTISNATVTWASSKEEIATIAGNKINLLTAGKTTITATYAGDETNYKGSTANYELTVTPAAETVTSFSDLQAKATSTSTPATITFNGEQVVFVNGSNAFLADANGNGALVYTQNHGLEAGQTLTGTINANITLYQGNAEITNFSKEGLTIGTVNVAPVEKTILQVVKANQSTLVTLKNVTYSVSGNDKLLSDGSNSIIYYDKFKTNIALEEGKAYNITGIVVMYNDKIEIAPRTADDVVAVAGEEPTSFRDIKADLTQLQALATESDVYIKVGEDGTISQTDNAENAAATLKGKWHGTSYGWSNFTASVPVKGCVKITYATHDYGNDIIVTNANNEQVAKFNTNGTKWMNNKDNVVVAYYRTNAPTTLHFSNANYNPYFAVEAIAEEDLPAEVTKYDITFAAGEGTGTAPAALEIEAGSKFNAPKNSTLYKEGYTLTGWSDGTTTYAVGQEITPTANMALTAVYTQNEVNLANRTEAVTVNYELGGYNDDPKYNIQGKTGIIVTQATVNGKTIDVKVDVDATSGKFAHNGSGWHQVNAGTKVTVPSCKGATIAVSTYNDENGQSMTFAGNNGTANQKVVSYTATAADATCEIAQVANNYWNKLTLTLPVVEGEDPGEEPVAQDITGTWSFGNADVMAATLALSGSNTAGEVDDVEKNGLKMTVLANGATFRNNNDNIQVRKGAEFRVPVQSTKDVITVKGYPGYSYYSINGGDEIKNDQANPQTVYQVVNADIKRGYVSIVSTNDNNYYYSIKAELKAPSADDNLVEKSIYKTDFSDWKAASAAKSESTVAQQTKFTNETLNFTLYNTAVYSTTDTKFGSYTDLPHMSLQAAKAADPYVTTSPLANITKVRYIHGATGSNRGWKLEAKGDGDADWVVISDAVANPAAWSEVSQTINKKNVQLRWTNLNSSQNAYMFELEIFGKVDLSGAPLLGSFKYAGKTYVADDIFEMNNSGQYEATIELFQSDAMPDGSANVLADVVVDNGEIAATGITYTPGDNTCKVVIPVTAEGKTVEYVANFVRKPFFTLTYFDTKGESLGTQQVEKDTPIGAFQYDIANVAATKDGYKARGWFKNNYVGDKYTTESVITENISLYAVETEIEVSSDSRKYVFDLTKANFYAEDHEAFTPVGSGHYHNNHGWVFGNGDQLQLLVGKKASITLGLCAYSADVQIEASNGQSIAAKVGTDGALGSFSYEGEAGTLTLTFKGTTYVHGVTILNTTTTNYTKDGNTFTVKTGDGSSFLDALEAANGEGGTERVTIFLPNGTYDLGNACLTTVGRNNITIQGESQTGVIIQNLPTAEGIGVTATLLNTSEGLTLENLTLKNLYPYYDPSTGKASAFAGRAVCLQDKGNLTVCKNVTMLSYQDTYYSNNSNGYFYFGNCDIHGLVDFVCGGGDVFYENTTFTLESREMTEGKGDVTIAAPNGAKQYGYVMDHCIIDCHSATFNWGRSWGSPSKLAWLNTTLKQPSKIASGRFTAAGMNSAADGFFEYNTVDESGNVISPASKVIEFTHSNGNKKYETILTDAEAADYSKAKVFADAPQSFKDRVGLGGAVGITNVGQNIKADNDAIYNIKGMRMTNPTRGLYIIGGKKVMVK